MLRPPQSSRGTSATCCRGCCPGYPALGHHTAPGKATPASVTCPTWGTTTWGRQESGAVGRVVGTVDATPLQFEVALSEGEYLQLDDVVVCTRTLPGGETVAVSGVVSQIKARHEGARFDSDVFLVEDGILPAQTSEVAEILTTVSSPRSSCRRCRAPRSTGPREHERDQALYFDQMEAKLPIGVDHRDEPLYLNLEFLDGTRGARTSTSAASRASRPRPPTPRSSSTPSSTRACSAPRRSTPRR